MAFDRELSFLMKQSAREFKHQMLQHFLLCGRRLP
jgi:hypothetical protein